jgi:hypothetical protein
MRQGDTIEIFDINQMSYGKGFYVGQFAEPKKEANVVKMIKREQIAIGRVLPMFPGHCRFDNAAYDTPNYYFEITRIVLFEKQLKENKLIKKYLK